jgi:hypothetical protein
VNISHDVTLQLLGLLWNVSPTILPPSLDLQSTSGNKYSPINDHISEHWFFQLQDKPLLTHSLTGLEADVLAAKKRLVVPNLHLTASSNIHINKQTGPLLQKSSELFWTSKTSMIPLPPQSQHQTVNYRADIRITFTFEPILSTMATNSTSPSDATPIHEGVNGTSQAGSGSPSSVEESDDNSPTFTLFPKLPLELRRKIWKEACSVPRLVDLWASFLFTPQMGFDASFRPMAYDSYSSKSPPTVLYASHESRVVAMENYKLCFGCEINEVSDRARLRVSIPAEIYVNW